MTLLYEMRKRARHVVGPVLAISVFGYFAYHSVQGDRGLIAWLQLGLVDLVADFAHRLRIARKYEADRLAEYVGDEAAAVDGD